MHEKRLLQFDDLYRLELIGMPTAHPGGKLIAYTLKLPERESGKMRSTVYLTDRDGSFDLPVRFGSADETRLPAFSPDGQTLAFLSDASGFFQICTVSIDQLLLRRNASGICVRQTSLRHGISEYVWSPDSRFLVFSAALYEEDPLIFPEMTKEELADFNWQKKHLPKYISELMYRSGSAGIKDGSRTAIGSVPVIHDGMQPMMPHMITRVRFSFRMPVFSPDGRLYFSGSPYGHKDGMEQALYVCDSFSSKEPEYRILLPKESYQGAYPLFAGNALLMSFTEVSEKEGLPLNMLYRFTEDGLSGSVFPETSLCHGISPYYVGITEDPDFMPPYRLSPDGETVYFLSGHDQRSCVFSLSLKDRTVRQVTCGDYSVTAFDLLTDRFLVLLLTTETDPSDLFLFDLRDGTCKRILHHNRWLEEIDLVHPKACTMQTADGPVQGFICPPADRTKGVLYPAFHYIHGGPEAYYAVGFDFEIQMMAACGLSVICCDPHGSAGFGPEFEASKWISDGTSYQDLMDFTDFAVRESGFIDPQRIGIGGGGHGGYMTNYIMGHTDRFRAAVVQRTWSNPSTSYGTGDPGFYSQDPKGTDSFMAYMEKRASEAVLLTVDNYKTPCLILHGEKDLRCSPEQGEQVFSAMKARVPDVPVRMVVYPGENHDISRTEKAHFRISHLREMIEWVLKYTKEETI